MVFLFIIYCARIDLRQHRRQIIRLLSRSIFFFRIMTAGTLRLFFRDVSTILTERSIVCGREKNEKKREFFFSLHFARIPSRSFPSSPSRTYIIYV